mmetsp:Transcript_25869/g.79866  ORF Transcript_25869/g.79866 Transcript_25869/m.79866 type:complete len:578 (-) Transcript_25869:255-1988(-)
MGASSESSEPLYDSETISANNSFAAAQRAKYNSFKVFKPPFVLALFVMMNFWTYYDRGCMATAISSIRSDPSIAGSNPVSQTDAGFLVSVFMVGFLVASPLFAGLGGVLSAKSIIICGLVTWCAACFVTGVMHGFWGLLITRAFVGVGEAAYAGYTVTMVDNMAPPHLRTLWIGIFYAMIPVGTAIGMAMGGVLSSAANTPKISGWRWCFLTEVIPMAFVVAAMCFLPKEYNPVKDPKAAETAAAAGIEDGADAEDDEHKRLTVNDATADEANAAAAATGGAPAPEGDDFVPLPTAVKRLATNIDYVCLVLGYGTYTFVLGAISVWAVSMMTEGPLGVTKITASLFLGGATAFTGLLGSLAGGIAVDKMGGSLGLQGVYKCSLFNVGLIAVSVPCGLIALMTPNFALFAVFFIIAVFTLFAITAPTNSAILTVVPKNLRTYAITCSITLMHAVGDVPSPVIAGAISDAFNDGCSQWDHANKTVCEAGRTTGGPMCVYVKGDEKSHTDPYCTNEYQLRNALAIVFAVIALAIPAFGVPAWRNRKKFGTAEDAERERNRERAALVPRDSLSLRNFTEHE